MNPREFKWPRYRQNSTQKIRSKLENKYILYSVPTVGAWLYLGIDWCMKRRPGDRGNAVLYTSMRSTAGARWWAIMVSSQSIEVLQFFLQFRSACKIKVPTASITRFYQRRWHKIATPRNFELCHLETKHYGWHRSIVYEILTSLLFGSTRFKFNFSAHLPEGILWAKCCRPLSRQTYNMWHFGTNIPIRVLSRETIIQLSRINWRGA